MFNIKGFYRTNKQDIHAILFIGTLLLVMFCVGYYTGQGDTRSVQADSTTGKTVMTQDEFLSMCEEDEFIGFVPGNFFGVECIHRDSLACEIYSTSSGGHGTDRQFESWTRYTGNCGSVPPVY